jgi:hypothetical protein
MARGPRGGAAGGGSAGATYYEIQDFRLGMDLRKDAMTAPAGTLRMLQNAHITPGGEIEKRPAFVPWCNAPSGTMGLAAINTNVYAFVSGGGGISAPPPDGSAPGVVSIPQPQSAIDLTNNGLAYAMISDGTGGTTPVQGNVLQIRALPNGSVSGMALPLTNGMRLIGTDVGECYVSTATDAYNYTVTGNAQVAYPSSAIGPVISGVFPSKLLDWDTFNGQIYATFLGTDGQTYHYYNGVAVPEANGKGSNVRTYKEKMWSLGGRNLYFSSVGDPTLWENPSSDAKGNVAANGSGLINIGSNDSDSENLLAMEVYYDKMAIFSPLSCQLWFLDVDPSLDQYMQTLRDAGTLAAQSVRQYVAQDVYFLGQHGIRSLRAMNMTMTAAVADVGSPLDPLIQELIANKSTAEVSGVQTILSPRTGRIWMAFSDQVFVLSNFGSPNISAWSVYLPEFGIAPNGLVFADPYVVLLGTDQKIYRFGGPLAYDSCPVQFLTPFLSFEKAASFKFYQGFDAVCSSNASEGWAIDMSFDPTVSPAPFDRICLLDSPTVMDGRVPISGRSTHVQVRATHQAPGPATFAKLFIHYAMAETD